MGNDQRVTGKDYSPSILNNTISYRRIVVSTGVSNSTSNTVTVTVVSAPITNNTITGDQTIDQGSTPATLIGSVPTGGSGGYSYQWQSKYLNSSWYDITGATFKDYSPGTIVGNTNFRRIVSSGTASPDTSNEIAITVLIPSVISHNSIAFDGVSTVIGSIPQGGNGVFLYEYYFTMDLENGLEASFGPSTDKDIAVPEFMFTYSGQYTVTVTRTVKSANRTSISQTMIIEAGISDITNNTLSFDGISFVTGSTPSGGPGTGYTYSWELAGYDELWGSETTGVATGEPIAGETGKDLSVSPVLSSLNEIDIHVRRKATSGTKISYSEWVSVNVPSSSALTINNNALTVATEQSLEEEEESSSKVVYPNPTKDKVNFRIAGKGAAKVSIYNPSSGSYTEVFSGSIEKQKSVEWSIPGNFPKGTYYYQITVQGKVESGRFIYE